MKKQVNNNNTNDSNKITIPEFNEDMENYDFDPKARLEQMNKLQQLIEAEQILLSKKRATGKVKNDRGDVVSITVNGLEKIIKVDIPSTMPGELSAPMVLEATNIALSKIRKKSAQAFARVGQKIETLEPINLK